MDISIARSSAQSAQEKTHLFLPKVPKKKLGDNVSCNYLLCFNEKSGRTASTARSFSRVTPLRVTVTTFSPRPPEGVKEAKPSSRICDAAPTWKRASRLAQLAREGIGGPGDVVSVQVAELQAELQDTRAANVNLAHQIQNIADQLKANKERA